MSDAPVPAALRRARAAATDDPRLASFDFASAAELFPTRGRRPGRHPMTYRRFARADEAVRFAMEDLPAELLVGAYLEVDEQRYDGDGIRRLYESERYPLRRRARA